jgi:hypothetical protein
MKSEDVIKELKDAYPLLGHGLVIPAESATDTKKLLLKALKAYAEPPRFIIPRGAVNEADLLNYSKTIVHGSVIHEGQVQQTLSLEQLKESNKQWVWLKVCTGENTWESFYARLYYEKIENHFEYFKPKSELTYVLFAEGHNKEWWAFKYEPQEGGITCQSKKKRSCTSK